MRLEDKARKRRRVRRLARSALASSIFRRKLGLRPEHVFPPQTRQRARVLNLTPPPPQKTTNKPHSQPIPEEKHQGSGPGSAVCGSFPGAAHITGAPYGSDEQSWMYTLSR